MATKLIAFFLPQYHEIPENNEWWGKGFTEWARVKNSAPLFSGHQQPRVPYKYYDLSEIKVLKEQSELALAYGIDGFCYYHYWFNGKKLLEKPLEMMIENKDIKIPFCLSWANEPWTRAWEGKPSEILMPQNYGNKLDWLKHLEYLIPFFEDKRYIRIDDKPIFLIYRTESFDKFDEMMELWNDRIQYYGIKGIYFVETLNSYQKKPVCKCSSSVIEFEPMFTIKKNKNNLRELIGNKFTKLIYREDHKFFSYDKVWKSILENDYTYNNKMKFAGAFVDWDNTPRFGKNASIFLGGTPEKFGEYLKKQINKLKNKGFIFINAWNEWAEGAYLEPDKIHNLAYLEAILQSKNSFNN